MKHHLIIIICTFFSLSVSAQARLVTLGKTPIGSSAVSVNSLIATTYNLGKPLVDCSADSLGGLVYVSAGASGKGFVAAINAANDSLSWINEGRPGNMLVDGKGVISSEDKGSVKFEKTNGRTEYTFNSPVLFKPGRDMVVVYPGQGDVVECRNLSDGNVLFSANIPRAEDWCDVKKISDSLWIVAASGLHGLHPKKGLLWSLPLSTSEKAVSAPPPAQFNPERLKRIGNAQHTGAAADLVTRIASNILWDGKRIYFAGREKLQACDRSGAVLWSLSLADLPVSRMYVQRTDSFLYLLGTGAAEYQGKNVNWRQPFLVKLDPENGKQLAKWDVELLEGLTDFMMVPRALRVATREVIFETAPGSNLKTISIIDPSYGQLKELINGSEYHTLKEGYFVPLNTIDKAIYYRSDNGKVYALERSNVKLEYNVSALYKFDRRFAGKNFLTNSERTLVTDDNFELLCSIRPGGKSVVTNNKVYFLAGDKLHMLSMKDLK